MSVRDMPPGQMTIEPDTTTASSNYDDALGVTIAESDKELKPASRRKQTAAEREAAKTSAQRAEDFAYISMHTAWCTITDIFGPLINAITDGWLRRLIPGCGHDHSKDHLKGDAAGGSASDASGPNCGADPGHMHGPGCGHGRYRVNFPGANEPDPPPGGAGTPKGDKWWDRVKQAARHSFSRERFIQYAKGEFIGDFAALPLTMAVQRFLPGVMEGLRKVTEPIMRPVFRFGIERDSKHWAKQNNVSIGSAEYKAHVDALYEHEMKHFPQAVVWTGFALPMNIAYQMLTDKSPDFQHRSLPNRLALKTGSVMAGVLVTAGVVVGARAFAPHKTREVEKWVGNNVVLPTAKGVGKVTGLFGTDDVERVADQEKQLRESRWTEQLSTENAPNKGMSVK